MDPFSLTVGILSIVQAVSSCLKLCKKHLGASALSSVEAESLMKTLYEFHGATRNFQAHLELNDDDDSRMASLDYLEPVVRRSLESAQIVKEYLQNTGTIAKAFRGSKFDKTLKASLKSLDDASKLFNIAVLSDQQTILRSVKKYIQEMNGDIKDIQSTQNNAQQESLYRDIRSWLSAKDDNDMNSQRHQHNMSGRHSGSCEWLLRQPTFQSWLEANDMEGTPTLWLKGSPGFGKSFLCSWAIDYVTQLEEVCLYYFYRFDYQSEAEPMGSEPGVPSVRVAALLVDQLFRYFWRRHHDIAGPVGAHIETAEKTITTLAEIVRLIIKLSYQQLQQQGVGLTGDRTTLYLFLDGVDEDRNSHVVEDVLQLFQGNDWTSVSSFDEHAEPDIQNFLAKAVPKFNDSAEKDYKIHGKRLDDWVLENLQTRAKASFLYAKLMTERLRDGVFSVDDIITFVSSEVPSNLAQMYGRIFREYPQDQHKYISLLFSIVAFARRPLYLHELQEAMTLAFSEPSMGLDPQKAPMNLPRLFAPLIEMQRDPKDPENPLCHLCHATVHEFLILNPDVLRTEFLSQAPFNYSISASRVGDLCLRYLSQPKYSDFLQAAQHIDHNSQELTSHHCNNARQRGRLLAYCAKYWDRHLEDLKPTPQLRTTVCDFIKSPNFHTLLQVQSLFVVGQFSQFKFVLKNEFGTFSQRLHRRVFPSWFGDSEDTAQYQRYRSDYRHFVYEWGYLLQSASCDLADKCPNVHFWGEADRCLSGLLGPTNILNRMRERYASFMLTRNSLSYRKSEDFVVADGIPSSKSQFTIISVHSKQKSEISVETWDLSHPEGPEIISTTTHSTLEIEFESDATSAISFSNEASNVKAGRCMFDLQATDSRFLSLEDPAMGQKFEAISTDFDKRGDIIVVASRNVQKQVSIGKSPRHIVAGKTSLDDADISESDLSEDLDSDSGESVPEVEDNNRKRKEVIINYQQPVNNNLDLEGTQMKPKNSRPTYPGMPDRFRDPKDRISASIAVYNIGSGQEIRLFHYAHDIPTTLYHSPPVLHPFKALVVWPLGGRDVLFADYVEKTYFIRGLMPTTRDTRQICMKAQFSPSGEYLHIASLEGRVAANQQGRESAVALPGKKDKPNMERKILLSVFLTTHRLSKHKTTRSPPHCIHRIKIGLGEFAGLSLVKLPITFTWTSEHLYFSISGYRLNVFRVELFKPAPNVPQVVVPQSSVMLPLSATGRQVHYLPQKDTKGRSMVLIGSYGGHHRVQLKARSAKAIRLGMGDLGDRELFPYPCPPVGFYVTEEDLGGWGPANDDIVVDGDERFRGGRLVRKMEYFNNQDDVDLEGICELCNRPLYIRNR